MKDIASFLEFYNFYHQYIPCFEFMEQTLRSIFKDFLYEHELIDITFSQKALDEMNDIKK